MPSANVMTFNFRVFTRSQRHCQMLSTQSVKNGRSFITRHVELFCLLNARLTSHVNKLY